MALQARHAWSGTVQRMLLRAFGQEGTPVTAWFYEPFYQIMRQRLLADRMVRNGELGVREAKVVIVVPDVNRAYRERITSAGVGSGNSPNAREPSEDVLRAALAQPDGAFCPAFLLTRWQTPVRRYCGNEIAEWSEYLKESIWGGDIARRIHGKLQASVRIVVKWMDVDSRRGPDQHEACEADAVGGP